MSRVIGFCLLLGSLLLGWLWMVFTSAVNSPLVESETIYIEIERGRSFRDIVDLLTEQGVLTEPFWFKLLAYREGVNHKFKAGEYELPPGITARQLLALMVAGKQRQHTITFVEGWNFRQILDALAASPAIENTLCGKSHTEIMALIGAAETHPEGLFFPDTYFFTKGTQDLELLKRAYGKMQTLLAQAWEMRSEALPLATPYEALTLASIIEKETAHEDERDIIAGVFVRRLQKGMLLQTDPTVIYGLGEGFDGNIRSKDLTTGTPYNTYVNAGLPPTPIAIPGAASIHAALHPAEGTSLYFVARGDGTHVFSTTLGEHEQAVDSFQRGKARP